MIKLLICLLMCATCVYAQPTESDLSRAHSFFITEKYTHALNGYKAILYYYVPTNFTIDDVHKNVPLDQLQLFYHALEGKIETERKLGIISLNDDSKVLMMLRPDAPKVTRNGEYINIDMSQVQSEEEQLCHDAEFEKFVQHLRKTGLVEKNEDIVWDEETKTIRLKMIKPCCKDCADGKPCIDEKKRP